ncbi:isochorismatase family protein [Kitasatospora sp. NPDC087861]|uniref:isochorismatase family protein n=1 Tax=Kitasatospora sp. NPDC087861 TaxID=3364070 RepID=UPI0038269A65
MVYTAQPPRQPASARGLLTDFWGPSLDDRPDDHAITGLLAPHPGDTVLTKHRYSAFHGTDLDAVLAAHGRDQLLVTGVYAHLGCLLTTTGASPTEYRHSSSPTRSPTSTSTGTGRRCATWPTPAAC